jgi:uncharacterized membrane protein
MRSILFILVSFIAVTSTLSGLLMISSPDGGMLHLPLSLLYRTPFKNFLVPGILLTVFVGSVNLLAVFYNMQRDPKRYKWATAGGVMITGWIIAQILIIQSAHWLHFLYLGIGILIILIAYQLKGKWAV